MLVQVERYHARRVGAVDERVNASFGKRLDDPFDRQHQGRRTADVVDQQYPCLAL